MCKCWLCRKTVMHFEHQDVWGSAVVFASRTSCRVLSIHMNVSRYWNVYLINSVVFESWTLLFRTKCYKLNDRLWMWISESVMKKCIDSRRWKQIDVVKTSCQNLPWPTLKHTCQCERLWKFLMSLGEVQYITCITPLLK